MYELQVERVAPVDTLSTKLVAVEAGLLENFRTLASDPDL
jgi:hypothetical protein